MLTGKVGVAPSTTTLSLPVRSGFTCLGCLGAPITEGEYRAQDIALRERDLEIRRKEAKWQSIAAIASAGLTTIAILAAVMAWIHTGKVQAPKVGR